MENFDKIEAYLDDELDDVQKIAFENELNTNIDLKMEFDKRQTLKLSLQNLMRREQRKEELKSLLKKQKAEGLMNIPRQKVDTKPKVIDLYFSVFKKMAAAILIMAFPLGIYLAYTSMNPPSSPEILAETAWNKTDQLSNLANTMGGEDSQSILKNVRALYKSGKYENGIDALSKIKQGDKEYPQSLLLRGMCFYKLNDNRNAIISFEKLLDHPNKSFDDKANWYLALSLLDNGNKRAAINILEKIVETNSTHWDQAKEILDAI